jgi:enoyl-CoA hydratase
MARLEVENRGTTRLLYFNAPPANGLNLELVAELTQCVERLTAEADNIRCLIIASRLERIFIAGADIKMIKRCMEGPNPVSEMLNFNGKLQEVINNIEGLPFPVIAAINGHALGGGLELALACDFRFMAKGDGRVGLPEVSLGLLPGAGGTQRLSRLIGKSRSKEIIFSSRLLDAEEAFAWGIVGRVCTSENLMDECLSYADSFTQRPRVAIAQIKACIDQGVDKPLKQGLEMEMAALERLLETDDAREGVTAFLEKRAPRFLGPPR